MLTRILENFSNSRKNARQPLKSAKSAIKIFLQNLPSPVRISCMMANHPTRFYFAGLFGLSGLLLRRKAQ